MKSAISHERMVELPTDPSGLRVDIAGCRVSAPPVKQRQRAYYIPREPAVSTWAARAESYITGGEGNGSSDKAGSVPQNPPHAFSELFTTPLSLADDVLFIPVSPATALAFSARAHCIERPTLARIF
ncbi:MAG: hypothetical protein HOP19_12040 [Acidobacteria bacterium]|nr:hypothetical protein [Acidobacteriota bacterium]